MRLRSRPQRADRYPIVVFLAKEERVKTFALLFRDVRHPRRLGVLRVNACSAHQRHTIADIEIGTVLRHKPSTIHLARPMRKFVNYFKVEIPRTDNYMNMIDETRPEQQAAWLERDGKHLTNAHKIANRDVQHPPTVMLASGNLFINQISRLGECWLLILPRR